MARFRVSLADRARRQLLELPDKTSNLLARRIAALADSPFPRGDTIKRLKTRLPLYRLRQGDYRAIFRIVGNEVQVVDIVHRSKEEAAIRRLLDRARS